MRVPVGITCNGPLTMLCYLFEVFTHSDMVCGI
jgi:hypothetical protein